MSIYGEPLLTGAEAETASGPIVSVNDALAAPLRSLVANIEPVQDLHGYDNPWPAGGGKNLISDEPNTANGYVANSRLLSDGTTVSDDALFTSVYFHVTEGETYTWSGSKNLNSASLCFYDSNKDFISSVKAGKALPKTIVAPVGSVYARCNGYVPSYVSQGFFEQLEKGSTATSFAPYSNICPISGWTAVNVWVKHTYDPTENPTATIQLGQTVYGGTLDVLNGVLTVDREMLILDGVNETWNGSGTGSNKYFRIAIGAYGYIVGANVISNIYKQVPISNSTSTVGINTSNSTGYNVAQIQVRPLDVEGLSLNEFKAQLTANPLQVVVRLTTPITIPLTPTEISTLQGQNNVWADNGDNTMEYLRRSLTYIS